MLKTTSRLLSAFFVATLGAAAASAAGPYDDLLKGVSPNANTIVLVNPKAAYDSPLGKAEKWAERSKKNPQGALGFVPPEAELVVISSEVNLTRMVRDFQVGVMKLRGGIPNMKDLAAHESGTMDELAGRLFVTSPRDVYITSLGAQELVAAYPADRQSMARWMRHAQAAKAATLSPFLAKTVAGAGEQVLVVALDVEDAIDPAHVRAALQTSPVMVKHKGVNLPVLTKIIAGAQGLTFTASVADTITGTIKIEFKNDLASFKGVLREIFLEVIEAYDVSLPGLGTWQVAYTDKSMTLTGPLTGEDLQRVLSLFAFPTGMPSESTPMAKGEQYSPTATRRYLDAVAEVLKGVRSMKDSPDYNKTATWHDKAAAQLDHINQRGVDPIATAAASDSARRLRAISGSLRGVPVDVDALSKSGYFFAVAGGSTGGYFGRGSGTSAAAVSTNLPDVQAKIAKAIADDHKNRIDLWTQIDQLMSDAQRKLMDKYKSGF